MKKRDFLKCLLLPFFIRKKEKYTVGVRIPLLPSEMYPSGNPLRPSEMYPPTPTIEKKNVPSISVTGNNSWPPSISITESRNPSISITRLPYIGGTYQVKEYIWPLE